MKQFWPVMLALALAALLTASLYGAVQAQTTTAAADPDPEPSAYLTLDMRAGFALDPFLVSLNGGGEVDASTLDPACVGFVNDKPVLTARWQGAVDALRVFFYSDSDSTLVIQGPDGKYVCADDVDENVLDAEVTLTNPMTGTYKVWVGNYDANQVIPGLLIITARPEVDLSTFNPAKLVKRAPIAEEAATPTTEEVAARADVTETARVAVDGVIAANTTLTASVEVSGTSPAFLLGGDEAACSGMVGADPSFLFTVEPGVENVRVFFDGNEDTTLTVVRAEGDPLCADDNADGTNANPVLDIEQPAPGTYAVYVGRFSDAGDVSGTLTVTSDPTLEPSILTPAQD